MAYVPVKWFDVEPAGFSSPSMLDNHFIDPKDEILSEICSEFGGEARICSVAVHALITELPDVHETKQHVKFYYLYILLIKSICYCSNGIAIHCRISERQK